ncbi:MAG TPA: nucleotidyltransferase substrate binding protein [Limnochordia bacterium]|nr:nucleotidyltransferase substrate binding protein [Limnochordia bacterium]
MERLGERLATAQKALGSLLSLPLASEVDDIVRDAAIQRFEYTYETVWKVMRRWLSAIHERTR